MKVLLFLQDGGVQIGGKVAVVTGASSGIGRATALALARRGVHLALGARRQDELEKVAAACRGFGVRALAIRSDVTSQAGCDNLVAATRTELGPIDILVNNAGFAIFDPVASATVADLEAMMQTNYFGAVRMTQAVLPAMLERKGGSVIFVSSIAGIMGFARMGGYCATKFALIGIAESLRDEVRGKGIHIGLVCPATTETEFFQIAERGKMPGASRLILAISPEKVAQTVVSTIEHERYRVIVPATAALYMRFKEMFPRSAHLMMRGASALLERKGRA